MITSSFTVTVQDIHTAQVETYVTDTATDIVDSIKESDIYIELLKELHANESEKHKRLLVAGYEEFSALLAEQSVYFTVIETQLVRKHFKATNILDENGKEKS